MAYHGFWFIDGCRPSHPGYQQSNMYTKPSDEPERSSMCFSCEVNEPFYGISNPDTGIQSGSVSPELFSSQTAKRKLGWLERTQKPHRGTHARNTALLQQIFGSGASPGSLDWHVANIIKHHVIQGEHSLICIAFTVYIYIYIQKKHFSKRRYITLRSWDGLCQKSSKRTQTIEQRLKHSRKRSKFWSPNVIQTSWALSNVADCKHQTYTVHICTLYLSIISVQPHNSWYLYTSAWVPIKTSAGSICLQTCHRSPHVNCMRRATDPWGRPRNKWNDKKQSRLTPARKPANQSGENLVTTTIKEPLRPTYATSCANCRRVQHKEPSNILEDEPVTTLEIAWFVCNMTGMERMLKMGVKMNQMQAFVSMYWETES